MSIRRFYDTRPVPEHDALPTYRWPAERKHLPQSCGHCGSRSLEVEPPDGTYIAGRVTCFICGHQAAWIRS